LTDRFIPFSELWAECERMADEILEQEDRYRKGFERMHWQIYNASLSREPPVCTCRDCQVTMYEGGRADRPVVVGLSRVPQE